MKDDEGIQNLSRIHDTYSGRSPRKRRKLHLLWAMVIRRRDAEAGADADAETQITIDFEAEGSSTDAY